MKPLLLVLVACAAVAHANNDGFEEWDATHTSTNQNIPDYVDPLWSERVCTYTTSWGYTSQKCCSGWTGAVARGCPTPVCTTPCENGGICIKPNVCECKPGYTGNTCDSLEKGLCWTEWMNLDSPQQGIGDYELLSTLRKEYAVCKHSVPVSIECETTGGIKVSGNSRENVVCDRRVGLTCDNTQTTTCEDYTVRMLCPCKSSNIDSKTCSYSGKEYDPEEITTQGCKTCTCLTTGRWSCSDDSCVSPLGHESDTGHVRYGICLLGGKVYKSFQTASYGASSCMCLQSGAWSCNGGMSSAVNTGRCSTIDGTQYETGDIINNDCNKCICDNSKWECTDLLCPTSGILSLDNSLCKAEDQLFQDGQVYRKDCNVCVCTTGKWDCSKYDCESLTTITRPESCTDIDGIQHNHGRIVNRDCNTCVCLNGEWGCTRRFCQPEIYRNSICMDTETNSPVSSGEFIVRDCNVCVCNSGTFTCTKATCTEGNCLRQQRKYDSTTPLPGAYRPTCLGDGTYAPKQCNLDRTLCFCVDKDGNRIQGSSTESETTLNCSPNTNEESQTPSVEEPTTTQNCLTQRSIAESTPGLYPPSCEPDGSYSPLQCHLATWMCHCVDVNGITIKGTVKHISEGKPDCERYRNTNLNEKVEEDTTTMSVATPCSVARTESQRLGLPSPNCQQDGSFTPMQCTAQMCYCVDRQGVLIPSTITPIRPNIRVIKPDCEQYNRVNLISITPVVTGPQTTSQAQTTVTYEPCFRHRELATNLDLTPMECNQQNGKFIPRQTTSEATYCIDKNGVAVPGTVTLNSPHNSAPDCEQYADLTLTVETSQTATMVTPITLSTPLGPQTVYIIPEPNTTISSLTLPKDLNTNNMTMCTRLQLMAITLEVPSPTCEPNGTFTPLQCTATACYCVDTQGMTIPGTETKITSTISTNINKSVCEKYRTVTITPVNSTMTSKPTTTVTSSPDTVLTSSAVKRMDIRFPEGTPCQQHYDLIKTNKIKTSLDCYANGTFVTKQQNLTSGVVYCVDVNGITVPGTVLVNNTDEVPANYCQVYSKVNLTTTLPVIPNPVVRPVTIPTPLGPKTVYVVPDNPLVDTLLPLTTNTNVKSNITYTIPPCIRMTEFTAALDLPSPSCHLENGTFTPLQSTSAAYMCVDTQGTIIPGTIVKKTAHTTTPDCEKYRNVIITPTVTMPMKKPVNLKSMTMPRNVQDTTCNKHKQLTEEQNVTPQTCHAENGTFTPLQCQEDVCYCVDMFGVAIPGTVTVVTATTPAPVCEQYRMVNLNATLTMPAVPLITPMTIQTPDGPEIVWTVSQTLNNITSSDVNTTRIPVCSRQQLIAELMKVEPPTCTKDGLFVPQQISESVTYCVDAQGTILINSITPVLKNTKVPTLNCYQAEAVNITPKLTTTTNNPSVDEPCNKQKTKTRALGLPNLTCHRQNGTFVPLQSHRDVAFCVDIRGVTIPGTLSPIMEGKTTDQTCEKYRYVNLETTAVSLPTPKVQPHVIPVTVFTPYGPRTMYMPLPTEKVTLDTTTSTTVPPCIKQQQVALTLGVDPPTCRPNGTFTTLQCTEKACYCVDTQGTLVPGTAVPITPYTKTMNLNCDRYWNTTIVNITTTNKPESRNDRNTERNQDVPSSSVDLCSRTRQTTESMNLPNMKCLDDDTFNPLQATNNVYYCVDVQGRVVPGTLIPITHGMVIPNCDVYKNVNFTTTTAVPPMPVSLPVVMPITINTPFGSQVIYVVPETETNLTTVTVPTDTPIVVPIATNTTVPPCTRAQQIASMLKTPSPTCQDNGLFQPLQCTRDVCYCVDINGVIVPQTIRSNLENPPKCDQYSKLSIINTTTTTVEKINEPQTQSSLEPVENTDSMDGLPCLYLGNLYNHGQRWMANPCSKCTCLNLRTTCVQETCELLQCKDPYVPEGKCCLKCPPMGPCTRHRRLMETLGLRGSLTCHDNGTFVPMQRRHGITYCVDSQGVTVPGTVTYDVEGRTRPNCEPYRTVNLNTTINGTVLLNPTLKPVVTNVTVITPTGPKTVIAVVTTNLTMEDTQVPTPFTGPMPNSANDVTVCSKNTTPTNIVAVTVMTENGTKTVFTIRQTTNKNNKTSPIHVPVITHTIVPPCTRHQQVAKVLGVHPPACEEKGMFSPLQCTSSVCYCVDMMGVIVPGTVRRTYDDDKPNCEQYKNVVLINMTDTTIMKKTTTLVPTSTGPCTYHQQLSTMFGVPKMNCHAENSTFTPAQCSGDVCYCVDKLGVSIPGTVTVTSDAASMKSDCEKYRDVNLNISLNGTVIYSPFTQPIVTNVTVLTLSGPETVWGVVGTLYNPVKLSNTTPPLPDSPTSSNLVPILANSPAGPKTVLMVHPMQSEPVMSPYDNSTSNYTTTIRTPSGTITVLVTFNTSWANLPFHKYITILRSTQTAPIALSRNVSAVNPPQQFKVTPHSILSVNKIKRSAAQRIKVHGKTTPYSTYPLFPVLDKPTMTQTTTDVFTGTTLNKLMPVVVISPKGLVTVLMPETTPLTTTNTTNARNPNATEPMVVPMTIMTNMGPKTLWTVVNTTDKNTELMKNANTPVVVPLVSNTTLPPCLRQSEVAKVLNAPLPTCESDGQFAPLQRDEDMSYCVDVNGLVIPETIIPTYIGVTYQCEKFRGVSLLNTTETGTVVKTKIITHPRDRRIKKKITRVEGPCTRHQGIVSNNADLQKTLNCHSNNGTFAPLQCPDVDTCFCVDRLGVTVPGTITSLGTGVKAPNCEQYRNVMLNQTVVGNVILPLHILPVVTNTTLLTPDGLKTVPTPALVPTNVSLTNNMTWLPFDLPSNVNSANLTTPQKVKANVTVMTPVGPKRVNVMATLVVTNSTINTTTLNNTEVSNSNAPLRIATPVRIPVIPTITVSPPKVSHRQNPNRLTNSVTPNIVTLYTNMYTDPLIKTTLTAPVTVNVSTPLLLTPYVPYNTTTTSTQTPWFVPLLSAKFVNITTPFNISYAINTTEVVIGPVTVITEKGPKTTITPYLNSFVLKADQPKTNYTDRVVTKIQNNVVTPLSYMTPWGMKKTWTPVVVPFWLVNMTQTSNLPMVTPTTITTPSGPKVIYTTQVPDALNITKTTPIVLSLVTNTTEPPCMQMKRTAETIGVTPPSCNEDGTFMPSQCQGKICYCVDTKGVIVPDTVQSHGRPWTWCENYKTVSLIDTSTTETKTENPTRTSQSGQTTNPRTGTCYRDYGGMRGDTAVCTTVLGDNIGRAECCCMLGTAWAETDKPCEPCPAMHSAEDRQLCPRAPSITWDYISEIDDINECEIMSDVPLCVGGTCINTFGSFTCLCPTGYKLDDTGRVCVVSLIDTSTTETKTENPTGSSQSGQTNTVGPCTRHQRIARPLHLPPMTCHHENGTFTPLQQVNDIAYCVDSQGVTIPGTLTVVSDTNPAPNCEPYRNLNLNSTLNGTIIIDSKTAPLVTNVTVMTPTGPKIVYTPVMTNTSVPLMTVPQTINNVTTVRKVTVMTSEGARTIYANVPWNVLNITNATKTTNTTVPPCIRQTQISKEIFGVVEPMCSPVNGTYEPLQYNPVTSVYYCVDTNGIAIPNTVTPSILPRPKCEQYRNVTLNVTVTKNGHMVNNTAIYVNTVSVLNTTVSQTCLQQRETAMKTPGAYVPFCEPNGTFTPLQCNPNTGYCFCVDPTGHVVPQTLAHVTQGTPACWTFNRNVSNKTTATTNESTTQPLCLTQQQLYTPVPGAFYPRCMPDGSFSPVQCQDSIGYCYCVTPDGTPIPGTTSLTGTPDCSRYMTTPIREDRPVPIPARSCHTAQQLYDTTTQLQAGAVRPWCEPDSSYSKVQCHVGLGYCFCVDPTTGEEIPGSETRGRPDCSKYDQTPVEEVVTEPPRNYECYDADGKGYELAQSSYRDCNKCWCIEGGSWRCTKKRCQRGVCYHNGRKAKAGSTIKKDCNTCTCVDGNWLCTLRGCVSGSDRSSSNTQTVSSDREVTAMCQNDEPLVSCAVDPCQEKPRCATNPFAVCIPSHCGSCTRVFYAFGEKVTCEDF